MPKVYRVDTTRLTAAEKQDTENKLRRISPAMREQFHAHSEEYIIYESELGDFPALEDFKNVLGLPEQCTVTDITGQDLLR